MEVNKLKLIIKFLVYELIAAALLFVNEAFIKKFNNVLYVLFLTIGITICTNAITNFDSERSRDNKLIKIASQTFSVLKYCQKYGLIGIYSEFPLSDEDMKTEFINSTEFYLVMNDAKNFISNHKELFEKRLRISNHFTNVIVQDYNQADIMSALTRKNGHKGSYYKDKIQNLIDYDIKNLKTNCNDKHIFSLYLNPNYNTLAILVTDNYAMMSVYRVAPGKNQVPHFVFEKNSQEYNYIKEDVKNITKISHLMEV